MTPDEVVQRMAAMLQAIRREQEIKEELLELEFLGDDEAAVRRALEGQSVALRQLEDLREEEILPLVEEMLAFIAQRKRELGSK